jgi:NTE family protein
MGENKRRRVGLALGGGVARGLAHIGVLSVLDEAGISIDFVAGTSAGSLIGATFCAGLSIDRIKEIAMQVRWRHIARPVWPVRGFVSFERMAHWLVVALGDLDFADLKIPFAAVATDLDTGRPVKLHQGRLAPAVQASCSVPGFVQPVEIGGRLLGDGSLANSVPVSILREMGADFVIGVDIFTSSIRPRWGPFGMGFTALEILVQRAGGGIDDADCLIVPKLGGESYLRFSRKEKFYQLGRDAAHEKLDSLRAALGVIPSDQASSPAASLSLN